MRVMVAEDEPLVGAHLVSLLAQAGCEVVAQHEDGEAAVHWLEAHPGAIDAMFLDIRMPRLTGLEVAAWPGLAGIPTVFVTSWADYAVQGFEVEAVDYLLKPVSLDRVIKAVARIREFLGPNEAPAPIRIQAGKALDGCMGIESVEAFEVDGRDVYAWILGKRYLALGLRTLKEVEKTFPLETFTRVGRGRLERVVEV